MSEWRAGSDNDDDDDLELLASPPPSSSSSHKQRLTKAEAQRLDDEAEYDADEALKARKPKAGERRSTEGGGGSSHKRASGSHSGSDHDSTTVFERVQDWIASKESTLGVVRPPRTGVDLSAGSGLTPDLTTQPWCISGATLHPHQMSALNWIKSRWELGVSCMLADEMGLGKTLCAISMMAYLMERAQKEPPAPAAAPMANGGKATGGSPVKGKRDAKSRMAAAAAAAASSSSAAAASSSAPAAAASSSASTGGRVGPFLILCPLTVLDNWQTELASFAPALTVQVFSGSKPEREELAAEMGSEIRRLNTDKSQRKDPRHLPFHVLLTTYECALSDAHFLSRFRWRAAIIDEAHRLKNADSVLSSTLLADYTLDWKLLLTGTPVQNNMAELWSMLYFLAPALFDDKKLFVDEFDILAPTNAAGNGMTKARQAAIAGLSGEDKLAAQTAAMENLHAIIRPFMLRRLKSDIDGLDIPPKREVILRTALTTLQKDIYRNLLLKNHELIGAGTGAGAGAGAGAGKAPNARALVNIVASLRKCCAHPYLFQGVEPEPFVEGDHLWQASGKFRLLRGLLRVLKGMRKRVLLFSTSVASLDVVQDLLGYLGYTYERLDGSVRGEERYEAIAKFKGAGGKGAKAEEETFVFLLSTRAGGVGLNLVCADTVIFLDSDWNPTVDQQAQARAHRIGQRKEVLVIRLLAANTLEEIILKRTQRKLAMTHNILEKGRFNNAAASATEGDEAAAAGDEDAIGRSAADLQNILQYGLDSLFGDGSAASSSSSSGADAELTEQEIEAIVTGTIDAAQKEASAALATSMEEEKEHTSAAAPSAAAASAASAATPDKRPAFQRISTRVLPSIDSSSLEPAEPEADTSLYVYEGTDYKSLAGAQQCAREREQLLSVEEELSASAAAGHKALQRLVAEARASGAMDAEDTAAPEDRYGSPNADRKRKAATQETDAERAVRIVKQRESAQKRADAAQRKKEDAEAARLASLAAMWADNAYESTSVVIDPKWEAQFAGLASGGAAAAAANVDAHDGAAEWMGGGGGDEEEHKSAASASASVASHAKAQLFYVIGDVSRPFLFEREDGQAGKTSQPSQTASLEEAAEIEISSSFDECAAAAAEGSNAASSSAAAAAAGHAVDSRSPSSALLLVPVDASGTWGKGGLFRALDARSSLVGAQYELIGSMQDLHQGDVHIVSIPANQVRAPPVAPGEMPAPPSELHVALCVVLKRAKGQSYGAPSIQPENLSTAFRKLSFHCARHGLSLHLPRLAQDDPNIGWYGVERQLQKSVVGRGVSTFVYYFKRRRPQYRSPVKTQISRTSSSFSHMSRQGSDMSREARAMSMAAAPSSSSSVAAAARASSAQPMVLDVEGESGAAAAESPTAAAAAASDPAGGCPGPLQSHLSSLTHFTDIFSSQLIYLHRGGDSNSGASMSDADVRLLTRFLSAYDGQVSDAVTSRVTHIVTAEPFLTPALLELKKRASQRVRVVSIAWVEQCVMAGQLDESTKMQIGMPRQ